jgi:lipopolysaccharide export system protein LptA
LRKLSVLAAFLASALALSPAWAEKADRTKPMNVEADTLRYDDLKQLSIFTGNVVLTKGTIVMRAARIEVRQDPEGYQYATITAPEAKLAFFRQKREGLDEWIEGESETIYYDSKVDNVRFVKRAVLRRYKGAALNDETTGQLITYDNVTDVFNVDGSVGNSAGAPAPGAGRIRAVLTPKEAANVSATVPSGGPTPQLRPSSGLGGGSAPGAAAAERK